jgi:hypothetical protein
MPIAVAFVVITLAVAICHLVVLQTVLRKDLITAVSN